MNAERYSKLSKQGDGTFMCHILRHENELIPVVPAVTIYVFDWKYTSTNKARVGLTPNLGLGNLF